MWKVYYQIIQPKVENLVFICKMPDITERKNIHYTKGLVV